MAFVDLRCNRVVPILGFVLESMKDMIILSFLSQRLTETAEEIEVVEASELVSVADLEDFGVLDKR